MGNFCDYFYANTNIGNYLLFSAGLDYSQLNFKLLKSFFYFNNHFLLLQSLFAVSFHFLICENIGINREIFVIIFMPMPIVVIIFILHCSTSIIHNSTFKIIFYFNNHFLLLQSLFAVNNHFLICEKIGINREIFVIIFMPMPIVVIIYSSL